MKKILNTVVTGGPSGGKTTSLKILKEYFEGKGYKVLVSEETATRLIKAGVTPDNVGLKTFQFLILILQLVQEIALRKAAQEMKEEKIVILYDRAVLDNRAYIKHEIFKQMIDSLGITEDQIMGWYDIIIHMVSPALDNPEAYSLENIARFETVEQARQVELDTLVAYPDCEKKVVFYNDCTFPEKTDRVLKKLDEKLEEWEKQNQTLTIQPELPENLPNDEEIIFTILGFGVPKQYVKH